METYGQSIPSDDKYNVHVKSRSIVRETISEWYNNNQSVEAQVTTLAFTDAENTNFINVIPHKMFSTKRKIELHPFFRTNTTKFLLETNIESVCIGNYFNIELNPRSMKCGTIGRSSNKK